MNDKTASRTLVDFLENTVDDELTSASKIDSLINKHVEAIKSAEEEIGRCRDRIIELQGMRDRLIHGDMTDLYALAEHVHHIKCSRSDCDFFETGWGGAVDGERVLYLSEARVLLEAAKSCGIPEHKCVRFFGLLQYASGPHTD